MKKIFIYTVISSFVFAVLGVGVYGANSDNANSAAGKSGNDNGEQIQAEAQVQTEAQAGDSSGTQTQTQTQNQGEDSAIKQQQQVKAKTVTELKQMTQEKKQEMDQEMDEMGEELKKVYQNQNQVRLTVHSLLASEELVGGIGPQVSEIARGFNNSVQATIMAEEKINSRSKFVKMFMGGDKEAADEIEQEVNANYERIMTLKQLMTQCEECDEEIRSMIQEQIMNTEREQIRLEELVAGEKVKQGLFGWFKNIFRFGK